jgi:predicted O-methyltransferase YrrM
MSRLDSAIRRLQAQRACLDLAVGLSAEIPGPVLEVGLGNGRTYDHLRQALPDRRIFAFDRQVAAHPDCIPAPEFLILGDVRETLTSALARTGQKAALIHADIGSGDEAATRSLVETIAPRLVALLAPGGILVSDQALTHAALSELPLPDGVKPGRYQVYRRR